MKPVPWWSMRSGESRPASHLHVSIFRFVAWMLFLAAVDAYMSWVLVTRIVETGGWTRGDTVAACMLAYTAMTTVAAGRFVWGEYRHDRRGPDDQRCPLCGG